MVHYLPHMPYRLCNLTAATAQGLSFQYTVMQKQIILVIYVFAQLIFFLTNSTYLLY